MYKIKYCLWLIGITICLNTNAYAMSADKSENCISFENITLYVAAFSNNDNDDDGLTNNEELTGEDDPNTPLVPMGTSNPNDPCDPAGLSVDVDCDGDDLTNAEEITGTDDSSTFGIPNGTSNPLDIDSPVAINITKAGAVNLTNETGNCYYGFNHGAPDEIEYPNSCGYNKASVWYRFTTDAQGGYYQIRTTNTTFDNVLTLFDTNVAQVVCVNDDRFSFGEHLYKNLPANTTYYIMISGAEDGICISEGVFCLEINKIPTASVPTNQECDTNLPTINLAANSEICRTGSNRYASNATPQPSCSPYTGASVWYKIKTPSSGVDKIQINAVASYSEVITVYSGTCGNLTEIACKLNGTDDTDDLIINNLSASTIYYIQVTGNFATIEAHNVNCNEGDITILTNFTCPSNGQSCNDYNPNTINDTWDGNCNCSGSCPYAYNICDDGRPETLNDTFDADCNCISECTIGVPCDDGDPATVNDRWTTDDTSTSCICLGMMPGACLVDIIVNSTNVSDGLFEASNSIETSGTVAVNGSLELDAGVYVNLKPGFSSTQGAAFHGYIDGCDPNGQKTGESLISEVNHYPNPFRDEVTLEFQLDFDADVKIAISDVNGRKITQIKTDNLSPGIQTHRISTQNWIAGIYFYQAVIKEQNTGIQKRANGTLIKM